MARPAVGAGIDADPTEREAWALLLSVERLGPAAFGGLLAAYGSGQGILAAASRRGASAAFSAIVAAAQGMTNRDIDIGGRIVALAADPGSRLEVLRRADLTIVTLDDEAYPDRLRAIDLPPPVLLVDGDVAALSSPAAVAIVGTRRPTELGRLIAARIGSAIARAGGAIISGLAVGIDGAAHAAVVAEGRPTVGVLGSGHGRLYPRAHAQLAADVLRTGGAVVSELFPDAAPSRGTFPQRNRLISGLADATIVVEAGARSGALITADWALRQGRPCFIVPGPIDQPQSAGCLALYREFRDVVGIVTGIPELLVDLGLDGRTDESRRRGRRGRQPSLDAVLIEVGSTAREVAAALVAGNGSIDELVATTGHEPATVLGAITLLEMRGLATSTYGRYRAAGRLAGTDPGIGRLLRTRHVAATGGAPAREPSPRGLPVRSGPC